MDIEQLRGLRLSDVLDLLEENDRLRKLVREIEEWSRQRCPCKDETPDPCPLCGARVDGKGEAGICKAGSNLPYHLAGRVHAALAAPPPAS